MNVIPLFLHLQQSTRCPAVRNTQERNSKLHQWIHFSWSGTVDNAEGEVKRQITPFMSSLHGPEMKRCKILLNWCCYTFIYQFLPDAMKCTLDEKADVSTLNLAINPTEEAFVVCGKFHFPLADIISIASFLHGRDFQSVVVFVCTL